MPIQPIKFPVIPLLLIFISLFLLALSCEKESPIPQKFESADELISAAIDDSMFAGAVFLAGTPDEVLYHQSYGFATRYNADLTEIPQPEVMTNEHLFDVASLTKVLATTYGLMVLHSRGSIEINDPVNDYLPEFDRSEKRDITIKQLLNHTSGLIPWFPSYYVASTPEERLQFIADEPLAGLPGGDRRYSDFGFMILGDLIEEMTGQPLDLFLQEEVYGPLGLTSTVFNPDIEEFSNIVSTSHGNPFEKKMVYDVDFGYEIDIDPELWNGWRTRTLRGEVNDGNAYYTHQGVAGHAGLFSTAADIHTLLSVLLNNGTFENSQIIDPETINLFLTKDSFGHGLGWMMSPSAFHAADLPEGSYGHTGFTGTQVIVNPTDDLMMIFLTNRQHGGVDKNGYYPDLREIREELSAIVFSDGNQLTDSQFDL